jgi:hypothetical protein
MTVNDLVAEILAFVRTNGPVGAVAWLMMALVAALAVFFFSVKLSARLFPRKSFDVGGTFDHFYKGMLPAARSGTVHLIYAGYAALWLSGWPANSDLSWLYQPYNSATAGVLVTLVVIWLVGRGAWQTAKAIWFALCWLRLEARGVMWHFTDNGEPHRVLWLRTNGEYLYDTTIRDHRVQQELQALHERRRQLAMKAAITAAAIAVWQLGPGLVQNFYPLLTVDIISFLKAWGIPILVWIVFLFVVIPLAVQAIAALLDELIYRLGAQFIAGAKVLEPRAARVGLKHVEEQMAHGDADFVKATDAVRRMTGRPEL